MMELNLGKLLGLGGGSVRKPSMVKDILDNPEDYKLEAYIEGGEVIVKIRKRTPPQRRVHPKGLPEPTR